MKKLAILLCICFFAGAAEAAHLKGGWIQYEYLGDGTAANTSKYRITVRQYLDSSSSPAQIDGTINLGIYNPSGALFTRLVVPLTSTESPSKKSYDPCINPNPPNPRVNYRIDVYVTTVDLPNLTTATGYTLAVQRCCRIPNIVNVVSSGNNTGITYTTTLPGVINGVDYFKNSNPSFVQRDTVLLCFSAPFTFDFSATDADGDSLSYSFCDGINTPTPVPKPDIPSQPMGWMYYCPTCVPYLLFCLAPMQQNHCLRWH